MANLISTGQGSDPFTPLPPQTPNYTPAPNYTPLASNSVTPTKAAPAVITTQPALNKLNTAQTVLNDQTTAMKAQADKIAADKAINDKVFADKAQNDNALKMLSTITAPASVPSLSSDHPVIPGTTDANGNYVPEQHFNPDTGQYQPSSPNGTFFNTPSAETSDYNSQLVSLNQQSDQAYADYKQKIDQIQNGTFPLTPDQQYQINGLQKQFDALKDAQKLANSNYEGGVTQAGISSGLQRYSPVIAFGEVKTAVDLGLQKISQIDSQAASAIATLRQGFLDKDYDMINNAYRTFNDLQKDKTATLIHLADKADAAAKDLREYNLKVEKDRVEKQDKLVENLAPNIFEDLAANPNLNYSKTIQEYAQKYGIDPITLSSKVIEFKNTRNDKIFDQQMTSDKLNWQQKQDLVSNALAEKKFTYQQQQDLKEYQLKLRAAERADTTEKYKDWMLAGSPGTYAGWLMNNSNKPATADQEKNAGFALRMKDSHNTINLLTDQFKKSGLYQQTLQNSDSIIANILKSSEGQMLNQAERDFVNSVLRRESGAAISPSEFDSAKKQYFPQPGDTDAVIAQKARNRVNALQGIVQSSGNALSDDFKGSLDKTIYTNVQQFKDLNPDKWGEIQQILKDNNVVDEVSALKIINGLEDSGDFKQPLSVGDSARQLAAAIKQVESGGNYNAKGASTEGGAYQFMPSTWKSWAKQYLGDPNAPMTPKNQDKVAESKIADLLAQGRTPKEIALIWNGGQPIEKKGVNKYGVKYDSGAYANKVLNTLKNLS